MGTYPGGNIIRVTPTLDTSAYGDNDVLFNPVEIPNAVSSRGGVSRLIAISYLNQNTTVLDIDLVFMQVSTDLGTINAAVDITDANAEAAYFTGHVNFDGSEHDCGLTNVKLYTASYAGNTSGKGTQLPLLLQAAGGSTSIYVAGVLRDGTPTLAADDIDLIFHIEYLG